MRHNQSHTQLVAPSTIQRKTQKSNEFLFSPSLYYFCLQLNRNRRIYTLYIYLAIIAIKQC